MQYFSIPDTPLQPSRIAYGCMEISRGWEGDSMPPGVRRRALDAIHAALDAGINFFDHADIYGRGRSEEAFSAIWSDSPGLRPEVYIQSKCGIRFPGDPPGAPGRFDFSYEHIVSSAEGSLRRLGTDYLDVLLLHRPDPLVEPEEVARAFDDLHASGKVRFFGVSNQTAAQLRLLRKYVRQPLLFNQVELNVLHSQLIDEGVSFNQDRTPRPLYANGTLEYCRGRGITIQTWGSLARGMLTGSARGEQPPRVAEAATAVSRIADAHGVSGEAVLVAWLLRHPARFQALIGTTTAERIAAACQGADVELSREEWYTLFIAGRGGPMP